MIDFENMPDVLTISDLQKALQIGRNTAYRLVRSKELRSIHIGKSIRIPKEYVKEFVKRQSIYENEAVLLRERSRKCKQQDIYASNEASGKSSLNT